MYVYACGKLWGMYAIIYVLIYYNELCAAINLFLPIISSSSFLDKLPSRTKGALTAFLNQYIEQILTCG